MGLLMICAQFLSNISLDDITVQVFCTFLLDILLNTLGNTLCGLYLSYLLEHI